MARGIGIQMELCIPGIYGNVDITDAMKRVAPVRLWHWQKTRTNGASVLNSPKLAMLPTQLYRILKK